MRMAIIVILSPEWWLCDDESDGEMMQQRQWWHDSDRRTGQWLGADGSSGTQFGHGNKINSRLTSLLWWPIVSWMIIPPVYSPHSVLQCRVMWVWRVICSSWLQHCSRPAVPVSGVCSVWCINCWLLCTLCSRHTRLIIDPGWLPCLIPPSELGHTWSTLWSLAWTRGGDQLFSDVSPQQNDNEIYNAAFSLSHNLGIPTLLQPSLLTSEITTDKDYTIMLWDSTFDCSCQH